MPYIRDAAIDLYLWREENKRATAALLAYRVANGSCSAGLPGDGSCFSFGGERAEWCEICRNSQPLWVLRTRAAHNQAGALRRLMALCRNVIK